MVALKIPPKPLVIQAAQSATNAAQPATIAKNQRMTFSTMIASGYSTGVTVVNRRYRNLSGPADHFTKWGCYVNNLDYRTTRDDLNPEQTAIRQRIQAEGDRRALGQACAIFHIIRNSSFAL